MDGLLPEDPGYLLGGDWIRLTNAGGLLAAAKQNQAAEAEQCNAGRFGHFDAHHD